MSFIKKYYPMIISISFIFLFFVIIGFVITGNSYILEYNSSVVSTLFMFIILFAVAIWTEIIIFIVHALKNKELKNRGLWAVLIYMFYLFIIPYYNLKYVINEKKVTAKMIIFAFLMVLSLGGGILYSYMYGVEAREIKVLKLSSYDEKVQFEFHGNYVERNNKGEFDLYVSDKNRGINVGVFLYDKSESTREYFQKDRVDMMRGIRNNIYKVSEFTDETDDKYVISEVFSGFYDNQKFIYQISTVELKNSNKIACFIQICFYEDYEFVEEEFKEMLINVKAG